LYDGISEDKAFNLCNEIFRYTKQQCDDVATHMSELKHLWKQLKEEVTKNESGNYDLPDLFLICKILGTLTEEYFPFKSSWMLISKRDRTIENLTHQLCAYEKVLEKKNDNKNCKCKRANCRRDKK
jgi:hypothetical protein